MSTKSEEIGVSERESQRFSCNFLENVVSAILNSNTEIIIRLRGETTKQWCERSLIKTKKHRAGASLVISWKNLKALLTCLKWGTGREAPLCNIVKNLESTILGQFD